MQRYYKSRIIGVRNFIANGIFLGVCWTGVTLGFVCRCTEPGSVPSP